MRSRLSNNENSYIPPQRKEKNKERHASLKLSYNKTKNTQPVIIRLWHQVVYSFMINYVHEQHDS